MAVPTISRTTLIAILVSSTAALVARAWLQIELSNAGMAPEMAADISYLIVPLVLTALLFPLWRQERPFLCGQFRRSDLNAAVILRALAIGVLVRLLWWCQLVVGVSSGFYRSGDGAAISGPTFSFQCGSLGTVVLGFFVMAFLVPVVEEAIHRGYIQTAFTRHGAVIAILISALVFAVFHRPSGMLYALFAGSVFGMQYWRSRSLWPSLVSHATINGLILIDWRCLSGQWNPGIEQIPNVLPGISAALLALASLGCLIVLIRGTATEAFPPR